MRVRQMVVAFAIAVGLSLLMAQTASAFIYDCSRAWWILECWFS